MISWIGLTKRPTSQAEEEEKEEEEEMVVVVEEDISDVMMPMLFMCSSSSGVETFDLLLSPTACNKAPVTKLTIDHRRKNSGS